MEQSASYESQVRYCISGLLHVFIPTSLITVAVKKHHPSTRLPSAAREPHAGEEPINITHVDATWKPREKERKGDHDLRTEKSW